MSVLLGPILQFRGISQTQYQVSALLVTPLDEASPPPSPAILSVPDATSSLPIQIASVPFDNPSKAVWRYDMAVPLGSDRVDYTLADFTGSFHVPASGQTPRLAYGSCNGFSDPKLMKQVDRKNDRWEHMARLHAQQPFHLLLLGGDQVYSDEMWKQLKMLENWTDLSRANRIKAKFTQAMQKQVDRFFADLYLARWAQAEPMKILQSLPSIMMWDDHDIMDGWGSYPYDLHNCEVYQGIFAIARRYFQVFQLQCGLDETHPCALPNQTAFHLGFTGLGNMTLLVPDLRSERQPGNETEKDQILSSKSWDALLNWLDQQTLPHAHLLLMSSIPVAYLDLGQIEKMLAILPGQQELEDDLLDHWRSIAHQQERLRLIHRLFLHAAAKKCRVTILSGDVHVGAASIIESTRAEHAGPGSVITQLVSTGIVHPAPPALVRYVLESIADRVEDVDRGITSRMQSVTGKGRYLIGARNWLALEPDGSNRLWANWHVEGMAHPLTKVIHGGTGAPDAA